MMAGLHIWIPRLIISRAIGFLLAFQLSLVSAQQGFLSINSCANSNITDSNGINWITDEGLFPNTSTCQEFAVPPQGIPSATVRTFELKSGKVCYSLKVDTGHDYLIRATFLGQGLGSSFAVLVGVTQIALVNSSEVSTVVEGVFRAEGGYEELCLWRQSGNPYITGVEVRDLGGPGDYSNYFDDDSGSSSSSGHVLKLVARVSFGSTNGSIIRYPKDQRDRIWQPGAPSSPGDDLLNVPANVLPNTDSTIPSDVLRVALSNPDRLDLIIDGLDDGGDLHNYSVFLYFLEPNISLQVGQRVFDVYVNGVNNFPKFDVLAQGSGYARVNLSVSATGYLNVSLAKASNASGFGPICNAYEVFRVLPKAVGSEIHDVDTMLAVKDEFLASNEGNAVFGNWFGDPCVPVNWDGLTCNVVNGSSVVSMLELSPKGLRGRIPIGITMLTHLTELNLSDNVLTGTIPAFPATSMLRSLDVRINHLSGPIPESLFSLPYLTLLNFGCNPRFYTPLPDTVKKVPLTSDNGICKNDGSSSRQRLVIGTVACGSVIIICAGIFIFCLYKRKFKGRRYDMKGYPLPKIYAVSSGENFMLKSISIEAFTLDCIEAATQNYNTLIGEGGFGSVYRGTLSDGQEVAVKVRSATSSQGTREFENELNLLSAIRHENLVPLLGYCCENDQQILVYPFMSNGSLQDRLYGEASKRKILDWPTRLSIALGAARGLTYLHNFSGRSIIHRDVKSSNILLDHNMNAKVADFGFSKYAPQEGDSGASLEVRGTAGYLDPEYYSTQHLTAKSDVFSFGVVLLEIISGREPLNIHRPRNEWSLVEWAKTFIREQKIEEIVDPNIKGMYHAEAMWRVVEVALACIEPFSAYRPSMADILRELEDALIIENNASEYMKSIDSFGGSARFSIVIEKKAVLPPIPAEGAELSPFNSQPLAPPAPR
ncbi:hypothetical protein MLD38_008090 [Melastoma candidum]|uniref:Uncharacterized protein n=1 Tax=Melastoma candidum TaxID=119954 RepID=A0ACB9RWX7_9MYRT|nr:hypothetical protein MLD38_008090 [Melastoma candidum]